MHKHKINLSEVKKIWHGVEEEVVGAVEIELDPGPVEVLSAIYLLGKDQDGYTAEEHAGGC